MTTQTNNNIRSENAGCRFFTTNNAELLLNHLDFEITEMVSEGVDSLAGQDSDDPYTVHNYWDVAFNGTQLDTSLIDNWLANLKSKQAATGEIAAIISVQITTLQGVVNTYVFTGITRKGLKVGANGRSDPFKFSSGFKAKKWVKT